jgi:hypothetical protein
LPTYSLAVLILSSTDPGDRSACVRMHLQTDE